MKKLIRVTVEFSIEVDENSSRKEIEYMMNNQILGEKFARKVWEKCIFIDKQILKIVQVKEIEENVE